MENYRGIKVTTLQATNTKPIRIKLTDLRYSKTVVISYGANTASTEKERVKEYLLSKGIELHGQTWAEKNGQQQYTIYLTKNFTDKI